MNEATSTETTARTEHAEVIVVGMGPGGEDVAGRLAESGLDVVGIDAELVGGECPYWGCVPSKMIIRAADLLAEAGRVNGIAGSSEVRPDWTLVAKRIRAEASDDWDDTPAVERFEGKGGRFVRGWARLEGPGRVAVGDRVIEASRAVVIATGARAWVPPVAGLVDTPYWTNREAIETEKVPDSLVVLGGGAIGVELAQAFSRFGAIVTVVEVAPYLVGPEEPEAGRLLAEVLRSEGIEVHTGVAVDSVSHDGGRFTLRVSGLDPMVADRLLVAAGRRVDLAALNSSSIGVDENARALPVDDHLRVIGAERTWAVGDVTGKGAFTHVSVYQADIVVNDILGHEVVPADYRALPRVTFTDPEIGSVGMTEREARDRGLEVRVAITPLSASTRGWIHKAGNQGFIKLVEDAHRGILVGATSMGPCGGEVLGLLTLAVQAQVPTHTLRHMIYAYPTFHRAIDGAIKDLSA
jgi:pyruvate/2-oxoglutarate dehydrogenase complex dihydrolipoamide dehydrogenase (E3) component